jgi:hypothetical protein
MANEAQHVTFLKVVLAGMIFTQQIGKPGESHVFNGTSTQQVRYRGSDTHISGELKPIHVHANDPDVGQYLGLEAIPIERQLHIGVRGRGVKANLFAVGARVLRPKDNTGTVEPNHTTTAGLKAVRARVFVAHAGFAPVLEILTPELVVRHHHQDVFAVSLVGYGGKLSARHLDDAHCRNTDIAC